MRHNRILAACAAIGLVAVVGCIRPGHSPRSPAASRTCQSARDHDHRIELMGRADDVRVFAIQSGEAIHTLLEFAQQGNFGMMYVEQTDRAPMYTTPVHGRMKSRDALTLMLKGTAIVAIWSHDGDGRDFVSIKSPEGFPGTENGGNWFNISGG